MRNNKGVTLVELLIVFSIIAILVLALGFSYQGWMARYKVDSVKLRPWASAWRKTEASRAWAYWT